MKRLNFAAGILVAAFIVGGQAHAQLPSGSDVNTAIPIYYQQMINDLGDSKTAPLKVYSITVSKGQQISATLSVAATSPAANLDVGIWAPTITSLANCTFNGCGNTSLAQSAVNNTHSVTFTYTASTAGVFYVRVAFNSLSVNYTLEVTTTGTIPIVPNPTQAGCLTGPVDSITYSLQLIAAGLPDSASIGGTQLCSTCTVKPPTSTLIVDKMEKAMGMNLGVSACYDATGSVFQLTLKHP